jgi:hypothetical protein
MEKLKPGDRVICRHWPANYVGTVLSIGTRGGHDVATVEFPRHKVTFAVDVFLLVEK